MNIVTQPELRLYPSVTTTDTIKGVELEGINEAIELTERLGAFALEGIETKPKLMFGDDSFDTLIKNIQAPLAAEALTVQAQLLRQIATGAIGEGAFTFVATDEHAGRAIKASVELSEGAVEKAATRPETRFQHPSLASLEWLLSRGQTGLGDDPLSTRKSSIEEKFPKMEINTFDKHSKRLREDIIPLPRRSKFPKY